jgi:hypothetical protein
MNSTGAEAFVVISRRKSLGGMVIVTRLDAVISRLTVQVPDEMTVS